MGWTRRLPKIGARLHYDTGHASNSWTGTLRAVVDDDQIVIRIWTAHGGWVYRVYDRWWWEEGHFQPGPLKRPQRAEEG